MFDIEFNLRVIKVVMEFCDGDFGGEFSVVIEVEVEVVGEHEVAEG
jgi:hypothetical protein